MRKTMKTARTSIDDGLRELAGVHQCGAPGCGRMLTSQQGKLTETTGAPLRTCYTPSCVQWAVDQRRMSGVA